MDDRADPRLVWLVAVLMAALTIVYVADRSMNPQSFHGDMSPTSWFTSSHS